MSDRNAIFISHATPEDNVFTKWLGAKLSAEGYEVWADVLRLVAGQDWQRKLESALRERAAKVLLVGTSTAVNKQGVRNEIQIASDISKKIEDSEFIIPLRLEAFDAPFLIAHAQYIDFSKSWASGLKELLETLQTYAVPKNAEQSTELWRSVHLISAKETIAREETLISNWLKFESLPEEIRYYDFNSGINVGYKDRMLKELRIPVVPHHRGFLAFADYPSLQEVLGPDLPIQTTKVIALKDFIQEGCPDLFIFQRDARNMVSNILRQGLEAVLAAKPMQRHLMTNDKICWFGQKGTIPAGQIAFNWNDEIKGRRQIIGYSQKRNMYWHYGLTPQVSMWPDPHVKLRARLIFSEDGITPIDNPKKMHRMRRSFTKSWRNARWRDMMLALLWNICDGQETLVIPFGEEKNTILSIPTSTFIAPVSMTEAEETGDENDVDDPDETEHFLPDEDEGLETDVTEVEPVA